ncbi:hypothetical protein R6Q59_016115 [Mikania micrantha]
MEVAVIDWKDSKFEKDSLYEDFNAPQWIDFSNKDLPVDDEAWFCRPDCNHPKTVEDFFRERSPDSSKVQRSSGVSKIRDVALKKRGFQSNKDSKSTKCVQGDENQNPNFSTPHVNKAKLLKERIKSSSEKTHDENVLLHNNETPRLLNRVSSTRNLFVGKDIFNQVTDFCHELKRLATRTKNNVEKQDMGVLKESQSQNERKPLLEVKQETYEGIENHNNVKEKLTKKQMNEESVNSQVSLNTKNVRNKDEQRLLQIRTNPPSPQCFSAKQKATPPKAFGLRPQEVKKEVRSMNPTNQTSPLSKQNEAKGLDVFWFFKPCTLSR